MLESERAWAERYAEPRYFSWIVALFGPLLTLVFMTGMTLYTTLSEEHQNSGGVLIYDGWVMGVTLLLTSAWATHNIWRGRRDPIARYWQSMPGEGLVELERHTLVAATSLWSDHYDTDCNTLDQWADGRFQQIQLNGVIQWVVAKTVAGHWLILKQEYQGDRYAYGFDADAHMQTERKRLLPTAQIAFAFAPGTQILLGTRYGGAPVPLLHTQYWLTGEEFRDMVDISHHVECAPPERYAVVNEQDGKWLARLMDKAKGLG